MNRFQRFLDNQLKAIGYSKAPSPHPLFVQEMPSSDRLSMKDYNQEQLEKLAIYSSWSFSNIDQISKLCSHSQLRVYSTDNDTPDPELQGNHEFAKLLESPNDYMGYTYLIRYTAMWLELRGEAYWMLITNDMGDVTGIWPIPSSHIQPIPSPDNFVKGYVYQRSNDKPKKVLRPEDICYIKTPNPFNYYRGLSKLGTIKAQLLTDNASLRWNLNTFENDVTLRTMISLPNDIADSEYRKIKAEIQHQLVEENLRYIIGRAGDISAKSLGMTQKDMEFLAGREFTREEIDRVFGFPAGYWSDKANMANATNARAIVLEGTIWPLLSLIHEQITSQIIKPYYGAEFVAKFDDPRIENEAQKIERDKLNYESMTINEVRVKQGLEPLDSPYGDVLYSLRSKVAFNDDGAISIAKDVT